MPETMKASDSITISETEGITVGGFTSDKVIKYDHNTRSFTQVGSLHVAQNDMKCQPYTDLMGERLVLCIGGVAGGVRQHQTYVYKIETGEWLPKPEWDTPAGSFARNLVACGNELFTLGDSASPDTFVFREGDASGMAGTVRHPRPYIGNGNASPVDLLMTYVTF